MSSKLVLPVALGLSIVTVTAFVVYYVFKKEDDNEEPEKTVKTSRENVIEVKVLKSIMPALVGRGRSNLNSIEAKSGAKIHSKEFTDGRHEVLVIRGARAATQLAETMVLDFIKQQPKIVDEAFTVPAWACGKIIGAGGANIKEIMHRSGARVKVEGLATDTAAERNVAVCGSKDQIKTAKELIDNYVAQERCRREVEQARAPRHAPRSASASPTAAHDEDPEKAASSIEVYVSAVSSPARFWVQFVGPQVLLELDELVAHMTAYYGNKENRDAHALRHVSAGALVACVFRHDGRWYRARVVDVRPNEFDVTQTVADVFFLDYGDSEYVATHELCELRADLLRLRFQAMECFLAGVRPCGESPRGQRWDKWPPQAVERFEELTHVAEWKPLVSRTCTYKKTVAAEGEKEKEIPGIKLYEVTDEGEIDIGAVLVEEGWAREAAPAELALPAPGAPFGDLGSSRVLGMSEEGSLPRDPGDSREDNDAPAAAKSVEGLETGDEPLSVSNLELSFDTKPRVNGSHDLINRERKHEIETVSPPPGALKANMNRTDSHHSNLDNLGRAAHELHK